VALAVLAAPAQARWTPHVKAARAYASKRPGEVSFAVVRRGREWTWHGSRNVIAASLVKPMLMTAYLRRPDVRDRNLTADERALMEPMIRWSDDDAAEQIRNRVGLEGMNAVARVARMRDYLPYSVSGLTQTSARDQARLFRRLPRILPRRHRRYALHLLRTIVPGQRWGIAQAVPRGWRIAFKGGWRTDDVLANHQAALLTKGKRRIGIAIMTAGVDDHAAGTETLRGIARRLLRGLR
jgi:hypothetical protein